MIFSIKNTTLFILTFCGFLFFLVNVIELNSNYENIKISNSKQSLKSASNLIGIPSKSQNEKDDLVNNFSKNVDKTKNKEIIIIVKKGQTFSSILSNFNFDNKKNKNPQNIKINNIVFLKLRLIHLIYFELK